MDAEKWSDYYERSKKSDGLKEAMSSLANGFIRELKSRMEQARRPDPEPIFQEVNQMWKDVASRHEELSPRGLVRLIREAAPELADAFELGPEPDL